MADNKQYVTKVQENGAVMISETVIATIVSNAISEVEGIAGLTTKPGADIVDKIGVKNWGKGMKIVIDEDESVTIDCNVIIAYGNSVVSVAEAAQAAVASALESTTAVTVKAVNINVCGIVRQ